jgi:hypothetical protein
MKNIAKSYNSIIICFDRLVKWYRAADGVAENLFRGIILLLILLLLLLLLSIYGVILLLLPKLASFLIAISACTVLALIFSTFALKKVKQGFWEIASLCSGFLFITFLSLFASGFIFAMIPPSVGSYIFPEKKELPLGHADGIAVDSVGNVYLAIPFYQRIQIYGSEGNFIKGLHVDSHGGAFGIWIEDELLHVFVSRTEKHIAMNSEGQILESSEIQSFEEKESLWKKASTNRYKDKSGNVYKFHDSKWFQKVSKTEPSGTTIALIANPIYLWLLKGPFPAWLFGLCSLLMIVFLKLRKFKYKYLVDLGIKSKPSPELDFSE